MGLFDNTNMPYTNLHDLNLDWLIKTIKDIQEGVEPTVPTSLFGLNGAGMPYTNLHELNLDWIIEEIKKLNIRIDELESIEPATLQPLMDAINAQVGTSVKYAREDHVHPVDTSRASQHDLNGVNSRLDVDEANITTLFNKKQKKLQAGSNIVITEGSDYDTISASGEIAVDYPSITNKPQINGVELVGNKTSSDLNIYHKVMLYSDGNAIYDSSVMTTPLTFVQIKALLDNATNDIALWNGNYILLPEYANTQGEEQAIWFNGTTSLSGKTYLYRIAINSSNQVTNDEYQLINTSDKATTTTAGIVKVGENLTVTEDGTLNATGGTYTLPIASADTLGGIKISHGLRIDSTTGETDVQPATAETIGGIMVGNGLSIDTDGVLSATVGLQMDLLWTNASPTTDFSAQTISLDLTNFKYVFISNNFWAGAAIQELFTGFYIKENDTFRITNFDNKIMYRTITLNNSSITFSDGFNVATYNGSPSVNNTICIPYKIYGIK